MPMPQEESSDSATFFTAGKLRSLKTPKSTEQWNEINMEFIESSEWRNMLNDMAEKLARPLPDWWDAQQFVDNAVAKFASILYAIFGRHRLVKKRSFGHVDRLPTEDRQAAPQHLR